MGRDTIQLTDIDKYANELDMDIYAPYLYA